MMADYVFEEELECKVIENGGVRIINLICEYYYESAIKGIGIRLDKIKEENKLYKVDTIHIARLETDPLYKLS